MPKISVIIVTIGVKDYLDKCLDSLAEQSHLPDDIIVVDNSLAQDLPVKLKKLYPAVKFLSGLQDSSYGRALNKGINESIGDFMLCLNDDVVLDRDFIRQALNSFMINVRIGSVSGKILRNDAKTLDSTGLFLSIWRTARERGYGLKDKGQFGVPGFIFGVNGAVAFFRKDMLDEVRDEYGYFDSRFRMFYEDLDLSWRARKKGWLSYYNPCALAYHVRGGSFRPDSGIDKAFARRYLDDQLSYELIKNRHLSILKNENIFSFFLHFIPMAVYDSFVLVYVIFFRRGVLRIYFARFINIFNRNKN